MTTHRSLTIAIIAGGHDAFVSEAVESVLGQECLPDEIVIFLNGRSSDVKDNLTKLVDSYGLTDVFESKVYQLVRFLASDEFLVTTDAMGLVLNHITTDYLVILDDDDRLDPSFTLNLMPYLNQARPNDVFVVRHELLQDEVGVVAKYSPFARKVGASPWLWVNRLAANFPAQFATGGTALPVPCLKSTAAYSAPIGVVQTDGLSSLRLGRHGYRGHFVEQAVYYVRRHDDYGDDKSWKFDNGMGVLRSLCIFESNGPIQTFIARISAGDRSVVRDRDAYLAGMSEVKLINPVALLESWIFWKATGFTFWYMRRIAYLFSLRRRRANWRVKWRVIASRG